MSQMTALPTIEKYLEDHPDADPKTMLQVLLEKNAAMREENEYRNMEYKVATEVEMDQNFNFKPKTLAQLYRLARMYADSGYVPDHYKRNVPNVAIAIQMALRCKVDIMTFLQSSYVVYGKPGIEGKLVTAMMNASGQIDGRVDFDWTRDKAGKPIACRAFATDARTGKELSNTVTWEMVEAEGWDKDKKGQKSKWMTLPDLMFAYRSATFLARVYFPDVLMGMHTKEELDDSGASIATELEPSPTTEIAELSERMGAAPAEKPKPTRRRSATAAAGTEPAHKVDQTANVASESTGGNGGTDSPIEQTATHPGSLPGTTPPKPPQERPAWLGLADMAGEAFTAGRFDFAARKYREAAGCHPSNSVDDPKVASLLKQAKACEAKACEAKADEAAAAGSTGPAVPPESHQTTTTKKAAAQTPAPSAPTAGPPGAPTAERATINKPGPGQQPAGEKVQWTPEKCRQYVNVQYSGEVENFDVNRLCEVAANQGAPQIYLDNILRRINPNWANFTAKPKPQEQQGPVGEDPQSPEDAAPQDLTEEQLNELDLREPAERPPMISTDAQQFEKMIQGYKQAKRIDSLIANDIEPSDQLTNDEVAWLMFLGRRKKRELAAIANKPANGGGSLPGMG